MPNLINDATNKVVETALDGLSLRQQIIGQNIANAETPGYQALSVSFEGQLEKALQTQKEAKLTTTDAKHLLAAPSSQSLGPHVAPRPTGSMRLDGNNVDVDLEMTQLAETSIRYQSLTELVSRKLALLRAIASGR